METNRLHRYGLVDVSVNFWKKQTQEFRITKKHDGLKHKKIGKIGVKLWGCLTLKICPFCSGDQRIHV